MKIQAFALVLLGVLSACGPKEFHEQQEFNTGATETTSGTESKITNGLGSTPRSFVSNNTVAIVTNYNEKTFEYFGFCTGVRLTPTLIITAAHCIAKIEKMRVVLGTNIQHAIRSGENVFEIENAIMHNQFSLQTQALERRFYDIALIKLKRALPANDDRFILASQFEDSLSTSQYLHQNDVEDNKAHLQLNPSIAGFGVSFRKNADSKLPTKLIGTLNEAPILLKSSDYIHRIIQLAPASPSQACVGDSGGALYIWRGDHFYLQGLTISIKEEIGADPFAKKKVLI